VVADAEKWGYKTAIDADVSNLAKAKADGAKVVDADIKSFQAVGGKVRDQYTAKNPLIADFYKQAKDL
jgi:TRAP-type transport system periplasmic protein